MEGHFATNEVFMQVRVLSDGPNVPVVQWIERKFPKFDVACSTQAGDTKTWNPIVIDQKALLHYQKPQKR